MSTRHNPLQVEQRYQELMLSLSLPATPYQRLTAIASFLSYLGEECPVFESHVIDVADRFRVCMRELHGYGHQPESLEEITRAIDGAFRSVPAALETAGVLAGIERMKLVCAVAYAYVGGWDALFRVLGEAAVPSGVTLPEETGAAGLRLLEERLPSDARALYDRIAGVRQMLLAEAQAETSAVWFPVVERIPEYASMQNGGLRRVSARFLGDGADGRDIITTDVAVLGVEYTGNSVTDIPMQAARGWLRRKGGGGDSPLAGQVSFCGNHALHEGTSSDLAIAAVLASAVLHYNNERIQYRIRPGTAVTGGLNPTGAVQPVDDATLCLKVEAVFFSPVKVFAVPRAQAEQAEVCVRHLRQRYPHRDLEVVGVRTLDDVFYDLRIISPERAALPVHVARMVWRRKSRTLALISTTMLLLIGGWYALGRIDREPIRVEYEGDRLRVLNKYNAVISEVPVGAVTVAQWRVNTDPWDAQHGYVFVDVDQDGMKDIVCAQNTGGNSGAANELVAWSIAGARRIWVVSITGRFDFPDRPDAKAGIFNINDIVAGDIDADGVADLFLAAAHTPSFPGMVQRIDVRTGEVLQTYVNTGHIADIAIADLDADGMKELFATGTNNAFNRAFLAVLNARSIEGCSPHTPAYRCIAPPTGTEEAYAILPRSILGETLGKDVKGNGAQFLTVDSSKGEVTVCVNDNKGNVTQTPVQANIILNFTFDRAVNPVAVTAGDTYDRIAAWALEQGYLKEAITAAYLDDLTRAVRVWKNGKEVHANAAR